MKKVFKWACVGLHILTCVLTFFKIQWGLYEVTWLSSILLVVILSLSILGAYTYYQYALGEGA